MAETEAPATFWAKPSQAKQRPLMCHCANCITLSMLFQAQHYYLSYICRGIVMKLFGDHFGIQKFFTSIVYRVFDDVVFLELTWLLNIFQTVGDFSLTLPYIQTYCFTFWYQFYIPRICCAMVQSKSGSNNCKRFEKKRLVIHREVNHCEFDGSYVTLFKLQNGPHRIRTQNSMKNSKKMPAFDVHCLHNTQSIFPCHLTACHCPGDLICSTHFYNISLYIVLCKLISLQTPVCTEWNSEILHIKITSFKLMHNANVYAIIYRTHRRETSDVFWR